MSACLLFLVISNHFLYARVFPSAGICVSAPGGDSIGHHKYHPISQAERATGCVGPRGRAHGCSRLPGAHYGGHRHVSAFIHRTAHAALDWQVHRRVFDGSSSFMCDHNMILLECFGSVLSNSPYDFFFLSLLICYRDFYS